MTSKKAELGFTLVELAIVLMIIGLLIAGVLRGQELLNNARIASTIEQIKAFQGAAITFKEAYSQLPGDMVNATNRVPGCLSTSYCANGNGDSMIGSRMVGINLMAIQTGTAAPGLETTMFWKHMALSSLISTVIAGANPATPEMGVTHPTAKIAGGFMVVYGQHVPNTAEGLWLVLTNTLTGTTAYNPDGQNALTPVQSKQFDDKMDDGMPDVGDVVSPDNGTCDNGNPRVYLNTNYKACVLLFRISA